MSVAGSLLTSSEVAQVVGVHPSTVKRWCNEGLLSYSVTDGGHRRLRLRDVMSFAEQRGIDITLSRFRPHETQVWEALHSLEKERDWSPSIGLSLEWMSSGRVDLIVHLFEVLACRPDVAFTEFCDEGVRGLMREVGDRWQRGRLRVGEEHLVSEAMIQVLSGLGRSGPGPALSEGSRQTAVVGTIQGSRHHLGSLCVRVLLERLGWRVLYLGSDAPIEDLSAVQGAHGADLVCVSLGPVGCVGDVARVIAILGESYDEGRPYDLAVGGLDSSDAGPGILAGPFRTLLMADSCAALASRLGHRRLAND